jgi:hypothetical protein
MVPNICKHQFYCGSLAFELFLLGDCGCFLIPYSAVCSLARNDGSMFHDQWILRSIVFITKAIQMMLADAQVCLLMHHTELFFLPILQTF